MAKYRALGSLYLRKLIKAGEEFESDLQPSRNWDPLDDEARAAVDKYKAERGKLLSIQDKLDPRPADKSAVEIPKNWKHLAIEKRRAIALQLGAQSNVNKDDADSFIEAEVERRGQKAA